MWIERDWNVENGLTAGSVIWEFRVVLILSIADSENRKTLERRGVGVGVPLVDEWSSSGGGGGWVRSSLIRVLRDWVRSWKGVAEMVSDPLQSSAHELMKCHVEVPSRTAWLNAKPIASPSRSLVSCTHSNAVAPKEHRKVSRTKVWNRNRKKQQHAMPPKSLPVLCGTSGEAGILERGIRGSIGKKRGEGYCWGIKSNDTNGKSLAKGLSINRKPAWT